MFNFSHSSFTFTFHPFFAFSLVLTSFSHILLFISPTLALIAFPYAIIPFLFALTLIDTTSVSRYTLSVGVVFFNPVITISLLYVLSPIYSLLTLIPSVTILPLRQISSYIPQSSPFLLELLAHFSHTFIVCSFIVNP